jgi:hypothetical protein
MYQRCDLISYEELHNWLKDQTCFFTFVTLPYCYRCNPGPIQLHITIYYNVHTKQSSYGATIQLSSPTFQQKYVTNEEPLKTVKTHQLNKRNDSIVGF